MAVHTSAAAHDPAEDRAAALFHELSVLESDEPRVADPMERAIARLIDLGFWSAFIFAGPSSGRIQTGSSFPIPIRRSFRVRRIPSSNSSR